MIAKKLLENQKIIADTISVSLSKKELELLIDKLSDMPIINKQALYIFQKLTEKLEQQLASLQRELGKLEKQLLEITVRLQKVEFELNLKKMEGKKDYD